jgi:hypothetical protein
MRLYAILSGLSLLCFSTLQATRHHQASGTQRFFGI